MCHACNERQAVADAASRHETLTMRFCALCLADALAVGWHLIAGGR